MSAERPDERLLTGRFVSLEPLSRAHLPELHRAIAHPAVFAGGYGGGPHGLPQGLDDFVVFATDYYQWHSRPYAVRVVLHVFHTAMTCCTGASARPIRIEAAIIMPGVMRPSMASSAP